MGYILNNGTAIILMSQRPLLTNISTIFEILLWESFELPYKHITYSIYNINDELLNLKFEYLFSKAEI